jgi:glycolate oxidase FAD binding subunit
MSEAPMIRTKMTPTTLLTDLRAIVGDDWVRTPPPDDSFAVDGSNPAVAVAPSTYEEIAAVMRYASNRRLAVIPLGGGTLKHIGNIPKKYDLALVLGRLNAIVEHEPADLTVTCQAGIPLRNLRNELAAASQSVPLCALDEPVGTVGGALAVNSWGPELLAFGTPRDYTIGLRIVTADGRITRAGGKVVKNVAGYDLCKLYIGSLGSLGIVVEATFKVRPAPIAQACVVVGSPDVTPLCSLNDSLVRKGLSISASWIDCDQGTERNNSYRLTLAASGPPTAVNRTVREILEATRRIGLTDATPWAGHGPATGASWTSRLDGESGGLVCRIAVLPSQVASVAESLAQREMPKAQIIPGAGTIVAQWPAVGVEQSKTLVEELKHLAEAFGGSLVITHCSPELKHQMDVFGNASPALELMRRVKVQFDPNGILSPGRFVGRL